MRQVNMVRTQLVMKTMLVACLIQITTANILRIGRNFKNTAVDDKEWPNAPSLNAIMTREEFLIKAKELIKNYKPLIVQVYKPYAPFEGQNPDEKNRLESETIFETTTRATLETTTQISLTNDSSTISGLSQKTEVPMVVADRIDSTSSLNLDTTTLSYDDSTATNGFTSTTEIPATSAYNETLAALDNTTEALGITTDGTTKESTTDVTAKETTTAEAPETTSFLPTPLSIVDDTTEGFVGELNKHAATTDATETFIATTSTEVPDPTTEAPGTSTDGKGTSDTAPTETTSEITTFLPTPLSEHDETTEVFAQGLNKHVATTHPTETFIFDASTEVPESVRTSTYEIATTDAAPTETTTAEAPETTSFLPTPLSELDETTVPTETFTEAESTPEPTTKISGTKTDGVATSDDTSTETTTDSTMTEPPEITSFLPTPLDELDETTEAFGNELTKQDGAFARPTTVSTEIFTESSPTTVPTSETSGNTTEGVTLTNATPTETATDAMEMTYFLPTPLSVVGDTTAAFVNELSYSTTTVPREIFTGSASTVAQGLLTETPGTTTDGTTKEIITDATPTETTTDSATTEPPEMTSFLPTPLNEHDNTTEGFVKGINKQVGQTTVSTDIFTEPDTTGVTDPTTKAHGTTTDGITKETTTDATSTETTIDLIRTEAPKMVSFLTTRLSEPDDTTEGFVKDLMKHGGVVEGATTIPTNTFTEVLSSRAPEPTTEALPTTTDAVHTTDATFTETTTDSTTTEAPEVTSFLPTPLSEHDETTQAFVKDLNKQLGVFATGNNDEASTTVALEATTNATTIATSILDETSFTTNNNLVDLKTGNLTNSVAEFIMMRTTLSPAITSESADDRKHSRTERRDNSIFSEFSEVANQHGHSSYLAENSQVKPRKIIYHTDVIPTLDDLFPLY